MPRRRAAEAASPTALVVAVVFLVAGACAGSGSTSPAEGADVDRPAEASMTTVRFDDVAAEVGIDFRHSAFRWATAPDPAAYMGGGVCWIDVDDDGWLDLFAVDTWSNGEWGRWRAEGALPTTRLYRNDRGVFVDATARFEAALEVRGNGCVAADLDGDGHTDLYVTTERENVLLWNVDGDRFVVDDGSAGVQAHGWHAGAAVGDVNGDGLLDLFVAGYADLNRSIPEATKGFPNTFVAEPDLLYLQRPTAKGRRPTFVEVAAEAGIEADRVDYGLGALFSDVDRDGDLDLYVANDTHPNRLYVNETTGGGDGAHFVDLAPAAGIDNDDAGMGVAAGDYDGDSRADFVVTNLGDQGHAVFRSTGGDGTPSFGLALDEMGQPDLGRGSTGWGTAWADLDLDGDLDLTLAHGKIPVTDLEGDREQLQIFENRASEGAFDEATAVTGLDPGGEWLARGLAAADYDNDGDVDLAVGTIGGDLALLRNTGAGGHWLVVAAEPATPGTRVAVTMADGTRHEREIIAGSSYLSSEDPRPHFGLGEAGAPVDVEVIWPDGRRETRAAVEPDQILRVGLG